MRRVIAQLRVLVPGTGRMIRVSVLIAILRAPVVATVPIAVRLTFDHAIPEHRKGTVAFVALALFVIYAWDALLALALRRAAARFATDAIAHVRHEAAIRLYALPRAWHDTNDPGMVHATIVNDSERVLLLLTQVAGWLIPTVVTTVALAAVAVVIAPRLALLLFVAVAATLAGALPFARTTIRAGRRNVDAVRTLSTRWRAALRLLPSALSHAVEGPEVERRDRDARLLADATRQLQQSQAGMGAAIDLATAAVAAATLAVGGIGVINGWVTLGALLSFYAVGVLLLRQVSLAAPGLGTALGDLSSVSRLVELLQTDAPAPYQGTRAHAAQGNIQLDRVTFSHVPERAVLRDIELVIAAGEHVSVLGPNGAGKSTLVSLLLGLYRPDSGALLIDGIAMDELDGRALRRSIGLAVQDPVLFAGTIAENIAFAHPNATRAEIEAAAELSTVADFLPSLPLGIDTPIGDEGVRLSGGQRQRVAIARALVSEPRLVILDEPTTYMDSAAIENLLDALDKLPSCPTVLTITHDSRVAARAQRVVHLRDGCIERIDVRAVVGDGVANS